MSIIFKPVLFFTSFIVTYFFGLFFWGKKNEEPDISWEKGRDDIFKKGIPYWNKLLKDLNVLKKNMLALEVGSGNGQWLIAMAEQSSEVYGVEPWKPIRDFSIDMVKKHSLEDKIQILNGSAEKLAFSKDKFDFLLCTGVFMFTNQNRAISEFTRVLKKGGKMVITVNGLGYFIMYVINGMRFKSFTKTKYGIKGIFNSLFKWIFKKEIGVTAVSAMEMKKKITLNNLKTTEIKLNWGPSDHCPIEVLGFPLNYVYVIEKK